MCVGRVPSSSSQFFFLKFANAHKSRPALRSVASRPALHTDCTHARTAIMWHVIAPAVAGVPQETHIEGMLQRVLGLRLQWRNRASGIQ